MNILTFDIEDWFHILEHDQVNNRELWSSFQSRIHESVDKILDLLASKNQRATFFCLGWIADQHPEIIRLINDHGHDIASHSYYHELVTKQSQHEFHQDLERSIHVLSDTIGKKSLPIELPDFLFQNKLLD